MPMLDIDAVLVFISPVVMGATVSSRLACAVLYPYTAAPHGALAVVFFLQLAAISVIAHTDSNRRVWCIIGRLFSGYN